MFKQLIRLLAVLLWGMAVLLAAAHYQGVSEPVESVSGHRAEQVGAEPAPDLWQKIVFLFK